jgi:hypothetical protein
MTVFLATELKPGRARPEADEMIEHELVPLATVIKQILSGQIRDGKTIASVLWLNQLLTMTRTRRK